MRSELLEVGVRTRGVKATAISTPTALEPSAVDAALGDETTPLVESLRDRRELRRDAAEASADGPREGALLRQLSRQLSMLELQQQKISRLLEETERCAGRTPRIR